MAAETHSSCFHDDFMVSCFWKIAEECFLFDFVHITIFISSPVQIIAFISSPKSDHVHIDSLAIYSSKFTGYWYKLLQG